ncbi:hypothetical protein [Flavobacterium soyae]|uniref:hypothetical protein n=1 Tax=Flavobacterium soyae TaxID=2903098 RepID=UPI001E46AEF3|nr:hypothetical protein [Flavobacterium soyae]MCD9576330.1 hypothetical protein [Flavobacterium soyae]
MKKGKINISGVESDLVEKTNENLKTNGVLNGKKIAISVSLNEDLERLGFSEQHLNDISIEIARYVISNEGTAMYGGDLRHGGFTYFFSELSNQYKKINDKIFRFINYFVFPNTKKLNRDVRIDFYSKQIEIKEVVLSSRIVIDETKEYMPFENFEDRFIICECFKEMRIQMAKDCDARILVGGKVMNYMGYIPGVIEEALYTLIENKPLYLIGGFGGASEKLIKLIKGETVIELSNSFQYNSDFLLKYKDFVHDKYNFSDYVTLNNEFLKFDLEKLSKLNKLSIEENMILFSSKNIHEILFLIMKGLKSL